MMTRQPQTARGATNTPSFTLKKKKQEHGKNFLIVFFLEGERERVRVRGKEGRGREGRVNLISHT